MRTDTCADAWQAQHQQAELLVKCTKNIMAITLALIYGSVIAVTAHAELVPATNLELWLHADAGIETTDGRVSKWEDQSGNGNDLVEGANTGVGGFGGWNRAANSPVLATERGHSVVRFDGNDYLHNHSGFASGSSFTAFFVVDKNADHAGYHNIALMGATGYANRGSNFAQSLQWGSGGTLGGNFCNDNLDITKGAERLATDTFTIVELRKENTPRGISEVFVNGASAGTPGTGTQIVNGGIFLGGWNHGNLIGDIAEVMIYDAAIGTEDRQLVEGILAWKYGLQTSLPNDHPYRKTNPIPETNQSLTSAPRRRGLVAAERQTAQVTAPIGQ